MLNVLVVFQPIHLFISCFDMLWIVVTVFWKSAKAKQLKHVARAKPHLQAQEQDKEVSAAELEKLKAETAHVFALYHTRLTRPRRLEKFMQHLQGFLHVFWTRVWKTDTTMGIAGDAPIDIQTRSNKSLRENSAAHPKLLVA